ncbi:MBL fold metallo-hydrolase [Ectopseudomonas mendocina]|uniref:MBL fold metallo-hydrolase n=1 Tax=Ectopseudomonas mendocina TaxID=300 RepID=A0ABD7RS66_ECTME|nr:MBL fold metallo-hydrolase [Pseudomonas mendocina]TRO10084.1 MBL fold metallo-hydrolase [Pseudomonas mendocina]TRO12152.1 MBL fold metallo-hydrolase [Pseudomonas mendocina]
MRYPTIIHHGAGSGVTGSCHQLMMDVNSSLLVDCGLFQGAETSSDGQTATSKLAIDFPLQGITALLVTHAHIDHVGRIPYLLAAGFDGPILCSEPTARLLPIVLEDAFKLGVSRDQRQVERYIKLIEQRVTAIAYNTWFGLIDSPSLNARVRLQRAGHILGSVYAEVDLRYPDSGERKRLVFSGDLGAPYSPILPAPKPPYGADILVLESTYGDRLHEDRRNRRMRLERVLEEALSDQGTVLIPAFSIGRTQELLYEIEDILHQKAKSRAEGEAKGKHLDWANLPIILDSPLASRFTQVYRELKPYWDTEALARVNSGRRPLAFENLLTVDSHAAHQAMLNRLAHTGQPAIVIAGNGMCSGGRIINYLKGMLHDPRHNVLFVGYQAEGTPGRQIQQYGPSGGYLQLDGQRYPIKAKVHTLGGYSAHADQQGLVRFVTGMRRWPSEIHLVHGELPAQQALQQLLQDSYQQRALPVHISTGAQRQS